MNRLGNRAKFQMRRAITIIRFAWDTPILVWHKPAGMLSHI